MIVIRADISMITMCMLGDISWEHNIVHDGYFVLISDKPCYIVVTLM